MAKNKTIFFCKECGYESSKWLGQCPACKQWDTFTEEKVIKNSLTKTKLFIKDNETKKLADITTDEDIRILTNITELDRVLGGGIVIGSLVLVGGDPGIGKSTLLLQMCKCLIEKDVQVLYVSGEESLKQIKLRAQRLGNFNGDLYLLSETNLDIIEEIIRKQKPNVVIIDSIQTMYKENIASSSGSISQVKEATNVLLNIAKGEGISIFIVGHVTKEGVVAGPRVLEHMVDTVLYFEGENSASYRVLRAVKNRFGSTNEIGVFEMKNSGLEQVSNPSQYMLKGKPKEEAGSVVTCGIEGTRPMLIEIQALVCQTFFNIPRRTAAGTDYNRVNLLLAVLEKRMGLKLSSCDVYINIAGGMKVIEPALDLAIIMAVISSYKNKAIDDKTIVFGEVGLTGEIRAVNMAGHRVQEAYKMGFKRCILPKVNIKSDNILYNNMEIIGIDTIKDIIKYVGI